MGIAGEAHLVEPHLDPVIGPLQSGGDIVGDAGVALGVGRLAQVAGAAAGLQVPFAGVRLDQAGGDLQQRRLAAAVAPDQRQPLAPAGGKLQLREQWRLAETDGDAVERQKRRGHGIRLNWLN
jgi:hypothetical protein